MTRRPAPLDPARRARHKLIRELLAHDIAAGTVGVRGLRAVYRVCDLHELDHHATCIVVRRLQAERGREAWATVLANVGRVEVGR